MNIHPLSSGTRKPISPERYRVLSAAQRQKSLISFPATIWGALSSRIAELEELESEGFIYCGEKYWLNDFIASGKDPYLSDYGKWVENFFKSTLGLNFSIDELTTNACTIDLRGNKIWSSSLEVNKYLMGFEHLKNPSFQSLSAASSLSINVIGSAHQPSPVHLCNAYEFLHGLEYFLAELRYESKEEFNPFEVIGINVVNSLDPRQWDVFLLSEYGSEFDLTLVDGVQWRMAESYGDA